MPFNGSGTFVLAEAAFVPSTVISSTAMNSDLSDIATGLSTAITKDGQTVVTGAIRFASGTVSLPAITFSADIDSGLYRIGANNIGFAVNATKILDIATTGLSVVGTVAPSTTVTNADGTVSLPAYTFASDLDSGVYRIGANNLGVAVNATKILDISTSGLNVIGTVSSNGAALAPLAAGGGMVNGTIVESRAGNAATFAIKTLAGTDPSASDPVYCVFRNVTVGTGNYVVLTLTAALSLVISSGSTLGFSSFSAGPPVVGPGKVWLVLFNDASTVRLGAINCRSGNNVYPLGAFGIASSTAEGGAGGADSAQVFYTGTAVSSKAYSVIGYAAYESGLTSAGAWASAPTRIQLFDASVPLPGRSFNPCVSESGAVQTGTTVIPNDDTIPQSGEGIQFFTQAITPSSATNVLEIEMHAQLANSAAQNFLGMGLFQDSQADALVFTANEVGSAGTAGLMIALNTSWRMLAGSSSAITFKMRCGGDIAGTTTLNGLAGARKFGGVYNSYLKVIEIMA